MAKPEISIMNMYGQGDIVASPYEKVSDVEVRQDAALQALVEEKQPNAVIKIPGFPEIIYLRTRNRFLEGSGYGPYTHHPELGFYFDVKKHALIDLEAREDGKIEATDFTFSQSKLRDMYRKKK